MPQFLLEKWYLDVVEHSSQRCFIGYAAALTWGKVMLDYHGFTLLPSGRQIQIHNSFLKEKFPERNGNCVSWDTKAFQGRWELNSKPVEEVLLSEDSRRIQWECFQPRSHSHVMIAGESLQGYGYVEKMTLSFMPWTLPIQQLFWGRFHSSDVSLIWIRWVGPVPKTLIFFNSQRITSGEIDANRILFNDYELKLSALISLRSGFVASNVFEKVPLIAKLFPTSILNLKEEKWLSQGQLFLRGNRIADGSAIHETVTWS